MRGALAVTAALGVLFALTLAAWGAGLKQKPAHAPSKPRRGLILSGSVRNLYPGARANLRVTVRNRYAFRLKVVSITGRAADASKGCRRGNLSVTGYRGKLLVRPWKPRVVNLKVTMARTAPNACKGAVFKLRFRAQGVRP
jgi:hypothetical protein